MPSLLEIVASADNFPYPTPNNHSDTPILDRYVPLYLTAKNYTDGLAPVGVLRPEVVAALTPFLGNEHEIDGLAEEASHLVRVLGERGEICAVYFADHTVRDGMMPTVMDNIISTWKEKGLFPRQLGGECRGAVWTGLIVERQLIGQERQPSSARSTLRRRPRRSRTLGPGNHSAKSHLPTSGRAGVYSASGAAVSTSLVCSSLQRS
jgi:hypothetical protein